MSQNKYIAQQMYSSSIISDEVGYVSINRVEVYTRCHVTISRQYVLVSTSIVPAPGSSSSAQVCCSSIYGYARTVDKDKSTRATLLSIIPRRVITWYSVPGMLLLL